MTFLKRELEGYVMIDHRDSPGMTPEQALAAGRSTVVPFIGSGKLFEGATNTCSHCQRIVIKNPDRVRVRAHCSKCDHFVCDDCGIAMRAPGYVHVSFKEVTDQFLERRVRANNA